MRPQIHSNKHHNAYNGAAHLPRAVSVKRATAAAAACRPRARAHRLYAVTLYYENNRACTIIRSHKHFNYLELGLAGIRGPKWTEDDVQPLDLQRLLQEAVQKCPTEVALERFLRRRLGDCGY